MARASAAAAFVLALAACGRVVAPPPPASAPAYNEAQTMVGVPVVVAAKAARVLRAGGFSTRRFGSDSAWAARAQLQASLRLRFQPTAGDSTRVLLDLWLPCAGERDCGRAEAAGLFIKLREDEAPPQ